MEWRALCSRAVTELVILSEVRMTRSGTRTSPRIYVFGSGKERQVHRSFDSALISRCSTRAPLRMTIHGGWLAGARAPLRMTIHGVAGTLHPRSYRTCHPERSPNDAQRNEDESKDLCTVRNGFTCTSCRTGQRRFTPGLRAI